MLQGRLFSYGDAQLHRLGVNSNQIPVNAPKCPFHSYHRDEKCELTETSDARRATSQIAAESGRISLISPSPLLPSQGQRITGTSERMIQINFGQPGALFRLMGEAERQRLFDNIARSIAAASEEVRDRHISNCRQADLAYGDGVALALANLLI